MSAKRRRKGSNIRNIIVLACLLVACGLGIGFIVMDKEKIDSNPLDIQKKPVESSVETDTEISDEPGEAKTTVVLSASIPELSCSAIKFDDDNIIFADSAGEYAFIEDGNNSRTLTVTDDSGRTLAFSADGGKASIQLAETGTSIESFVYKRHLIELKDGMLFYDSSPVRYSSTSFSAYKLTEDVTLECVELGKYRLRGKDGKLVDSCKVKEVSGASVEIFADENGFYAEGVNDGLFYNVFKLNDDVFYTTWGYVVYINGSELVPYGYNDKYVNPSSKGIGDSAIEPTGTPVDYGDVNRHNDNISETTAEMLSYVNEVREQYGLNKLYGLELLDKASETRVKELTESFSHTRPGEKERSYTTAVGKGGDTWWHCAENIAKSSSDDMYQVFESWLSSEEHRASILDPKMKYLSASKTESDGEYYWELLLFNDTYVNS